MGTETTLGSNVHKTCTKCKTIKPATEFGKRQRSADGLNSICKPCASEGQRISKQKRKAEFLAMGLTTAGKPRQKISSRTKHLMPSTEKEIMENIARSNAKATRSKILHGMSTGEALARNSRRKVEDRIIARRTLAEIETPNANSTPSVSSQGLSAYTSRQLMLELRKRGYDGELVYKKSISLSDLE